MNDRMLVQRKLAATPTFTPPKSTPLTPDSTQKSAVAVPQAVTELQPSLTEVQSSTGKQETPDLQTQLERAARFGHHFGRISVLQPQAKLTVSQPGDSQHQQASRVAERVMGLPTPKPLLRPTLPSEVSDRTLVQRKLTITQAGDKYEQEADRVADQVMANSQVIQRQGEEEEQQEAVLLKPLAAEITPVIQRQVGLEEEPLQRSHLLQQRPDTSAKTSSNLESQLQGTKGGGSPLPDEVRDFMESRIGADFSSVRVHTDEKAVQMNKELNAQAFTHGRDVYFGAGKYNPGSSDGKQLLAHELTHVVQQTGAGKLQRKAITGLRSNKETLQAKIRPVPFLNAPTGATIQLKQNPQPQPSGDNKLASEKALGKSPASPQQDSGFQAVVERTQSAAAKQKKHEPAFVKSQQAQAAAIGPANEVKSKAQDRQVKVMSQQQPGTFNAAAFKAALMQKIAAITPNTLEEADKFKDNNQIGSVKQEVSSQVTGEKKQAQGAIENKAKETPNTSGISPKPVAPLPPKQAGPKPPDVGAAQAAPKPKPASEVSLQAGSKALDQQMAEAKITEQQLAKSNEPSFNSALAAKKTAQTDAAKAPSAYRQKEQATLTQAQAQAQTTVQKRMQAIHGGREQLLAQVVGLQGQTKGQDEQERSKVANDIQKIYEGTKQKVETSLTQLDTEVNKAFDQGAAAAQQQFENYVDQRMKRYKEQRYSGALGWGRWLKDKVMGMPSEVNAFYQEGKKQYLTSMGKTIDRIASLVSTKLNAAKAEVAKGKQEIQKYVTSLPQSLRQVGQEAAQNIQGKFDELETSVNNKQNELIDSLAQKYTENLQQLDARVEEMKAANRGLVDKVTEAMGGVIETILELKNMLMGVLSRAAGAVEKIIKDPIGFLGNLVAGLKRGFQNFAANIWQHLKKGLLGWLTGAMAGTGIQMPQSFDLKGIFSLVTQVLGLVYETIRPRAVKVMGEKAVNALESSFEMFVILKNQGVAGLWQFIHDKIGDLKAMVIDTIQNFVVQNVIKAGVIWVLSLLNPASAFVKACKAIYDIIMFFIERGSQIAELINAVMESVTAIANGAIGGAAKLVENALSKALPVVISFMASLLGLGGISEKVQAIIKKVRQPIEKAIDWVIEQAVKVAKKIGNKLGFGKDKDKKGKEGEPDKRTEQEKKADLDKALDAAEKIMEKDGATPDSVRVQLPTIQSTYKLTSLELVKTSNTKYHVKGKVNPQGKTDDKDLDTTGTLSPIKTLEELYSRLTEKARQAFEQQKKLGRPVEQMVNASKNSEGTYNVQQANNFFENKWLNEAEYNSQLTKKEQQLISRADREIQRIDNSCKETDGTNRPGASLGDGTTETALNWEVGNAKPYKSKEGHYQKVPAYLKTLQEAVNSLTSLKTSITNAAKLNEIDQAIIRAQNRINKLQPALDNWNNRATNYPSVWNSNGTSKVTPGWP